MRKIQPPRRRLDAPWSVSQDEPLRFGLMDGFCLTDADLQMPPYPWQFVQNEIIHPAREVKYNRYTNIFVLSYVPILPASTTATVYCGQTAIQTFVADEFGGLNLTKIGTPDIFVENGNLSILTGQLELHWNNHPGHNYVVVSYEYEYANSMVIHEQSAKTRFA